MAVCEFRFFRPNKGAERTSKLTGAYAYTLLVLIVKVRENFLF